MGVITLYCQPGAKQTRLAGEHDGKPKLQLKASPVEGAANDALRRFLAEICAVPIASVKTISGSANRTKRVEVLTLDDEALRTLLMTGA